LVGRDGGAESKERKVCAKICLRKRRGKGVRVLRWEGSVSGYLVLEAGKALGGGTAIKSLSKDYRGLYKGERGYGKLNALLSTTKEVRIYRNNKA